MALGRKTCEDQWHNDYNSLRYVLRTSQMNLKSSRFSLFNFQVVSTLQRNLRILVKEGFLVT